MSETESESLTPGIPERGGPRPAEAPEPTAPERVMSIHAHPDDQEFTVGGTLAKWAKAGSRIVTVCLTNGSAATLNAACTLGLGHDIGSIEVGKRADLVVLDAPNLLHLLGRFIHVCWRCYNART